jgi:hypothetical protein
VNKKNNIKVDKNGNYFDKYRYLRPNQLEKKKQLEEEKKSSEEGK